MSQYNERINLTKIEVNKYLLELDEIVFANICSLIYSAKKSLADNGYPALADDAHDLWKTLIDTFDALED